jgi:hypothetical protein
MGRRVIWALAAALLASPAGAELQLQKVQWQLARKGQGRVARFEDIAALSLEGARLPGRLRAKLSVLNRGPQEIEGVLLRYCVAAKIAPKEKAGEAAWTVPFLLEEKRVPKIGPNHVQEVILEPQTLPPYFPKILRQGFRVHELRLQVMVEPRAGDDSPVRSLEGSLSVAP